MSTIPDRIQLITCQARAHLGEAPPTAHWRLWTLFTVNHFCTACVLSCGLIWELEEGWKIEFEPTGYLHTGQLTYPRP